MMKDKNNLSLMGLLVTLGIVFGDIGTSPLYVMSTILHVNPHADPDYITGVLSCVIWTLTLQTTVKYVLIALKADNHGEGGILALYALLKRSSKKWLYVVAAVGASTLIADGVITPAITITSAIEGLKVYSPHAPVTLLTVVIISVVFFVQRFGTEYIGRCFGPFMLCWFLMLGIFGCVNIGAEFSVLKSFNPYYAVHLLIHYPGWFFVLGAVFLCTTGAEALYSDLGHCGRMNISVSWIFVKCMLILNYLGQGAWIISHGETPATMINPFYGIMPSWFMLPGIIMSTGAAVIASQALISGSFTIFREAMNLDFSPSLRIKYPTGRKGQLYIPAINGFLYVGCVVTVLLFGSSAHMEAAYGLAITVTMLMTTLLLTFYLRHRGVYKWLVVTFFIVFAGVECVFLMANMVKFAHGGWYTMAIAGVICSIIMVWYMATATRARYFEYENIQPSLPIIEDMSNDRDIPKYASNLVYISHSKSPAMVEGKLLYSLIKKQPKRADHYWLVRVEYVDEPNTLEYTVDTFIPGKVFSIGMRFGFLVTPHVSVYLRQIIEDMVAAGEVDLTSGYPSLNKYGISGDFRFIIIHRIFSTISNCRRRDRWIMTLYEKIRLAGVSTETALGLDTSIVNVENVPLIINTTIPRRISPAHSRDQL